MSKSQCSSVQGRFWGRFTLLYVISLYVCICEQYSYYPSGPFGASNKVGPGTKCPSSPISAGPLSAALSKVQNIQDRKKLLLSANQYFNCLKADHKALPLRVANTLPPERHHQSLVTELHSHPRSQSIRYQSQLTWHPIQPIVVWEILTLQNVRVMVLGESKEPQHSSVHFSIVVITCPT